MFRVIYGLTKPFVYTRGTAEQFCTLSYMEKKIYSLNSYLFFSFIYVHFAVPNVPQFRTTRYMAYLSHSLCGTYAEPLPRETALTVDLFQ